MYITRQAKEISRRLLHLCIWQRSMYYFNCISHKFCSKPLVLIIFVITDTSVLPPPHPQPCTLSENRFSRIPLRFKVCFLFLICREKLVRVSSQDYGRDLQGVQNLLKKHKRLEGELKAHEPAIQVGIVKCENRKGREV